MLFNSLTFLCFLPIVFAIYWCLNRHLRWQNLFVIAASYVFYGWWDWRFLILIAFTSACSYASGLLIGKSTKRSKQRLWLWSNITINLGILGAFKYFNFFAANFAALMSSIGWQLDAVTLDIILPVGVSFYTFQALSYSIDVYRGKLAPTRDAASFFAFISFFPQLVAGPIERATNLLPQFIARRKFEYAVGVSGLKLILWGLFKKMVVADNVASYVNLIFGGVWETAGSGTLFIAAFMFTIQIYCDFSGYSDIAIGTARLFGIRLMRNFSLPYFSRSISEFWRRWHISLTSWFRDYVYIPLGGNRGRRSATVRNTIVVFLVSGLWHGAEWTFVAWGAYHALLQVPAIFTGKKNRYKDSICAQGKYLPSLRESLLMSGTFLLVLLGWVIFRAENLTIAGEYLHRMFTCWDLRIGFGSPANYLWCAIMLVAEWISRERPTPLHFAGTGLMKFQAARWTIYWLLTMTIIIFFGKQSEFIYFQF